MNSDKVMWLLEKIAATESTRQKESMLSKYAEHLELRRVLDYAYNPYKHYGIIDFDSLVSAIESGTSIGFKPFTPLTWSVLNKIIGKNVRGITVDQLLLRTIESMTKESALLLVRILKKNLQAGISAAVINKAIPELIPIFPYMRCSVASSNLLDRYDFANGVFVQNQIDGMYVAVSKHSHDDWCVTTKNGDVIPNVVMKPIFTSLNKMPVGYQLHGAITVSQDGKQLGRVAAESILNDLMSTYSDTSSIIDLDDHVELVFHIWDVINHSDLTAGRCDLMYGIRYKMLSDCISKRPRYVKLVKSEICHSLDEVLKVTGRNVKNGFEGTIIKNWFGPWTDGISPDQAKIKPTFETNLKIVGILHGLPGTRLENKPASCICETEDGSLTSVIPIEEIGMQKSIQRNQDRWLGRVIKVAASNVTTNSLDGMKSHSLLHAYFSAPHFRTDSDVADSIEQVFAQCKVMLKGNIELKPE